LSRRTFLLLWLTAFVVLTAGNVVFHTLVAGDFFMHGIAQASGAPPPSGPPDPLPLLVLLLLYVGIALAMVYWMGPRLDPARPGRAALDGALFRLTTDGMWHVANFVVFPGWTAGFVAGDMAFNVASGAVTAARRRLER
jgi:hypothetical protein